MLTNSIMIAGISHSYLGIKMNLIQELEKEQLDKLSEGKKIPDFAPGDTVRVNVRISEGTRERERRREEICAS